MKIYAFAKGTRNSKKVAFTAELLALDYELVALDPRKGEHKTPEFLSISPLGKIPALQDGNHCIAESSAISFEKAVVDQWIDMFSQTIGPVIGVYYTEEVVKPKLRKQPTDKNNLIEADKQLAALLPLLEAWRYH